MREAPSARATRRGRAVRRAEERAGQLNLFDSRMTTKQFAGRCGVDERTVRRWVKAGRVHPERIGGRLAFTERNIGEAITERNIGEAMNQGGQR